MDKTLEAFARLADEYGDATLTIVGIGEWSRRSGRDRRAASEGA
ncbi:MAG: hypothetical protein ACLUI3_13420 [Christensenellales bacterium]